MTCVADVVVCHLIGSCEPGARNIGEYVIEPQFQPSLAASNFFQGVSMIEVVTTRI